MDAKTLQEIAYLARLRIDESEMDSMLKDFNKILEYVDHINEIDVSHIQEMDLYPHHENATRQDVIGDSLSRDEIAKLAPKFENGYIVVPKVIET